MDSLVVVLVLVVIVADYDDVVIFVLFFSPETFHWKLVKIRSVKKKCCFFAVDVIVYVNVVVVVVQVDVVIVIVDPRNQLL